MPVLAQLASCARIFFGAGALVDLGRQFDCQLGNIPYRMMGNVFGGGLALTLYALGEGVYLFIAIEDNTRTTVALLAQRQAQELAQPPAPDAQ
jgi:hypothetical protein